MASNEDYSQLDISLQEKDKLVGEVMRYVLFKTHQSSGVPMKREELTQIVTKNYSQRSLPALVINETRLKLASIFGFDLKELNRMRPSSNRSAARPSQQSNIDAKSYIIVSKLPPEEYTKYVENKEASYLTGFAFVALSIVYLARGKLPEGNLDAKSYIIVSKLPPEEYTKCVENKEASYLTGFAFVALSIGYLAGGKLSEENIWHQLKKLGLSENDEKHPIFGNSKQTLDMLVQQRYLQKEKVAGPEGNTIIYELAERALDESISAKLKSYIAQVVNKESTTEVDDE